MQNSWLHKQDRNSCIIFFGGWGMDPTPFQDIEVLAHDLLMVYDYSRLEPWNFRDFPAGSYEHLHLVAWSMGVWAAAYAVAGQEKHFATTTAINGTLSPIDDTRGIERKAFADMISGFSPPVLHAFYESMFTDPAETGRFLRNRPQRPEENILHELVSLGRYYDHLQPVDNIYGRIIVGSRDRIFPARNQLRSWGRDKCSIIKAPHFPFYQWSSWDHIISAETGIA
jgi:biotin synthesis protein BioG